jgi:hypothetical protein
VYRYGLSDLNIWSQEFSFVTPVGVGPNIPTKIFAFGDMGIMHPRITFSTLQTGTSRCGQFVGWCEEGAQGTSQQIQKFLDTGDTFDMVLHVSISSE